MISHSDTPILMLMGSFRLHAQYVPGYHQYEFRLFFDKDRNSYQYLNDGTAETALGKYLEPTFTVKLSEAFSLTEKQSRIHLFLEKLASKYLKSRNIRWIS